MQFGSSHRWLVSALIRVLWCSLALAGTACQPTTGVGAGPDGAGAGNDGGAARTICAPPANVDEPKVKLSDTGCMDSLHPTLMAPSVLAYDVNSPLWSDGADKSRGFVLPADKKIHVKNCAKEPNLCRVGPEDDGRADPVAMTA